MYEDTLQAASVTRFVAKILSAPDLRLFLWHTEMEKKLRQENKKDRNKGARNLLGLLVSEVVAL